jgi:membrane-associated protease RseP (regulator of RpoE activity)
LDMSEIKDEQLRNILGPAFELDYYSRLKNYYVFQADARAVEDQKISQIIASLLSAGYFPRIQKQDGRLLIHITTYAQTKPHTRVWLNVLLFLLTIVTTMMAGAVHLGKDYFSNFANILYGSRYSFAVLSILTAHEFGHYFAARWHDIKATLPYYIPLPLPGFHFGTLGAFIKMKSPIQDRKALLDVGAAGPIAGFIISIIFLIVGYHDLPDFKGIVDYVETIHPWNMQGGINIILGKSLLFSFFNDVIGGGRLPMNEVYHFPYIFAGWIGLLVTAINLIPIGQLDGGHILYSLTGNRARFWGIAAFVLLLVLNFVLILQYFSFVWVLWVILIFVLIGFKHPPTVDDQLPLNKERKVIGWLCVTIFVLCFPPLPIYIS